MTLTNKDARFVMVTNQDAALSLFHSQCQYLGAYVYSALGISNLCVGWDLNINKYINK